MALDSLKTAFSKTKKPGKIAYDQVVPQARIEHHWDENYHNAAVLAVLFARDNQIFIPLIKRTTHPNDPHSGQISLPGGRVENLEQTKDAALRETEEEIGLKKDLLKTVGELTSFPVPVSKTIIHPYLAIFDSLPSYILAPAEVERILELPLNKLLSSTAFTQSKGTETVPKGFSYLEFTGEHIWGATAMILSELREMILKERDLQDSLAEHFLIGR